MRVGVGERVDAGVRDGAGVHAASPALGEGAGERDGLQRTSAILDPAVSLRTQRAYSGGVSHKGSDACARHVFEPSPRVRASGREGKNRVCISAFEQEREGAHRGLCPF